MNPIAMLTKQHRAVEALFKKIEKAKRADQRRALLGELASDLTSTCRSRKRSSTRP